MTDGNINDTPEPRKWWIATGIQVGTGDRISEEGPTPEAARTKLTGKAYGAHPATISVFPCDPPK